MQRTRRPMLLLRAATPALAVLVALAAPCAAEAQPAPAAPAAEAPADATYKLHMKNGVKLYQDKNFEAAIAEFQAAYAAVPKVSPLLNVALSEKGLFNYPKAIAALELALSRHGDAMAAADRKTAEEAIAEMSALLAYVAVTVTPPEATLTIDGDDQPAGAASARVPLGPGTHKIGAHAPGYASAEETITVASGESDRKVELALVADEGFVTVVADDAETAIAVDGRPLGYGQWAGLVSPGSHVVQMYKEGGGTESRQILVVAGKAQEVRRGTGGIAINAPPPALPEAPKPPGKVDKRPPVRGFFALASGSLLGPTRHPTGFPAPKQNSGAAGGLVVGYRVNTAAAFDAMFEYGNVTVTSTEDGESDYSLSSTRLGLNLRLMTPGRSVRFVGSLGGGVVNSSLSFDLTTKLAALCKAGQTSESCNLERLRRCTTESCAGLDPFVMSEIGLELEFGGVLLDAALEAYAEATKGIGNSPYDNEAVAFVGGGLRIGYGAW